MLNIRLLGATAGAAGALLVANPTSAAEVQGSGDVDAAATFVCTAD